MTEHPPIGEVFATKGHSTQSPCVTLGVKNEDITFIYTIRTPLHTSDIHYYKQASCASKKIFLSKLGQFDIFYQEIIKKLYVRVK